MEWIRERRKDLNYSQEDLARALQLSGFSIVASSISHWENGRFAPPLGNPEFVAAFARILKMDVLTILEKSGYPISVHHSSAGERVARLMDTMPVDKQQLALRIVEQLLD